MLRRVGDRERQQALRQTTSRETSANVAAANIICVWKRHPPCEVPFFDECFDEGSQGLYCQPAANLPPLPVSYCKPMANYCFCASHC